jgi:hypothetical protein
MKLTDPYIEVVMLREWGDYAVGEIVTVSEVLAENWRMNGIAKRISR